jgi:hypothetical protein
VFSIASNFKSPDHPRDPETIVRMLARAVIRRVCEENPGSSPANLQLRLSEAYPFQSGDETMQRVWNEEMATVFPARN